MLVVGWFLFVPFFIITFFSWLGMCTSKGSPPVSRWMLVTVFHIITAISAGIIWGGLFQ